MELCLYRKATHVVTVTNGLRENLVGRGIDGSKIDVVTNGANMELFTPREKDSQLLNTLGLEDKFIIGYIGTHGMAHGLEFIIESIKDLKDKNIHFLFVGTGAKKEATVNLAKKLRLTNVTFLDPVPKSEVNRYISIIDVALVPLTKTVIHASLIPSKIFESSAMKKPMLLGVEGEAKEIVEHHHAGVSFEPENKKEFLEALQKISSSDEYYLELQKGCTELAKAFDRKNLAKKMFDVLEIIKK
jgi:hypothetical protein